MSRHVSRPGDQSPGCFVPGTDTRSITSGGMAASWGPSLTGTSIMGGVISLIFDPSLGSGGRSPASK